ncbi:MAG: hypothetical protein FWF84_08230, partial [Kiritimatiellaeota bacterium]|nr:hypothetical protein [Kiritimatiellota bacterium]
NGRVDMGAYEYGTPSPRVQPTIGSTLALSTSAQGSGGISGKPQTSTAPTMSPLQEKMRKIIIPEINFRQANITDVITFLGDASREYDDPSLPEEKRGINLILSLGETTATPTPVARNHSPFASAHDTGVEHSDSKSITIQGRNISLENVLDIVMEIAGLKYIIRGNLVMVVPNSYVEAVLDSGTIGTDSGNAEFYYNRAKEHFEKNTDEGNAASLRDCEMAAMLDSKYADTLKKLRTAIEDRKKCQECKGTKSVACQRCNGSGRTSERRTETCGVCKGTGQRPMGIGGSTMPCRTCSQSGQVKKTVTSNCWSCSGTGKIRCPSCQY